MFQHQGCITLLGAMSLSVLSAGAEAACPFSTGTINGHTACLVNMSNFQSACSTVSGLSYTPGTYPICEESLRNAISAAGTYLSNTETSAFVINIDAGTYDYSAEASPLSGLLGAIDVSGISPKNEPDGERDAS